MRGKGIGVGVRGGGVLVYPLVSFHLSIRVYVSGRKRVVCVCLCCCVCACVCVCVCVRERECVCV